MRNYWKKCEMDVPSKKAKIIIDNWKGVVPKGTTFLQMRKEKKELPISFSCRTGRCGLCAVKVREGRENLSKPTKIERQTVLRVWKETSYRLVCQCSIQGDVTLEPLYRPLKK